MPRWVRPSVLTILVILLGTIAVADVGLFLRADCTAISAPTAGQTWCFDQTANALKLWSGSGWVSVSLPSTGILTTSQGGTGQNTSASTGTPRIDTGTWSVATPKVESYTLASLPAAGTAGRLARVTDNVRGLATDLGDQYLLQNNVEIQPEWFGAKGDGATDDTTAFVNAVAALPANGGILRLRAGGTYLVKNWVISKSGLIVKGGGAGYIGQTTGVTTIKPPNGVVAADEVVKISAVNTFAVTIKDVLISGIAPNGTDQVGVTVASIGTRLILQRVGLLGGSLYAFDNKVDGVNADSSDSGGIFNSWIYSRNIRIASSSFRFHHVYYNGNAVAQMFVDAVSGSTAYQGIKISDSTFDSMLCPIIDVGTSQTVNNLTITGNRFSGCFSPTGKDVLTIGHANGVQGLVIEGNQIDAPIGGTADRAITIQNSIGVSVKGNFVIGTYAAGTGAPLKVVGVANNNVSIGASSGLDVEWNGYRASTFMLVGTQTIGRIFLTGITLTTTDATPTTIFTTPDMGTPSGGTVLTVGTRITALRPENVPVTGGSLYERQAAFVRRPGGASSQVGTTAAPITIESDAAADATIALSGNGAIVQVTGVAAQTYNWVADIELRMR